MSLRHRLLDVLRGCWFGHAAMLTENGQEIYWKCGVCGLRSPTGIPHDTSRLRFIGPSLDVQP